MSFGDELKSEIAHIFGDQWSIRDGQKVPDAEDLKLGNDAVKLTGTVLYADLAASTALVDSREPHFAAEIYKAYLHSAAKIIRSQGGAITSYDGDRIMAVYIGSSKNTNAARTGLKINYIVKNVVNPALKKQYPDYKYEVQQTVGIDMSSLWVSRTGIRGSNDLVWVGRAANYAAKLSDLSPDYPTWITADVYAAIATSLKAKDGMPIWEARSWTAMGGQTIYRSNWWTTV
ncbi:MAG: adenylate/guanylate cyclase domain-containing protein [Chlorobiaceae bacterium]|nr:adenylate/guanylate cyclase domain-containing protein [Chlorobiaceae bacterium]